MTIDYGELLKRSQEANRRKLQEYAALLERIRLASYRSFSGEPGETVESILDEHAKRLRDELDEFLKHKPEEPGESVSGRTAGDGSASQPGGSRAG